MMEQGLIMTKQLTQDEFKSTFTARMLDVTETAEPTVNIWPYVQQLTNDHLVLDYVYNKQLVEKVYRNYQTTFDHILLPTNDPNVFMVIVVDLVRLKIMGHLQLDLNKEYGID